MSKNALNLLPVSTDIPVELKLIAKVFSPVSRSLSDSILFVSFKERLPVSRECQLSAFLFHQAGEHLTNGEVQKAGDLP